MSSKADFIKALINHLWHWTEKGIPDAEDRQDLQEQVDQAKRYVDEIEQYLIDIGD